MLAPMTPSTTDLEASPEGAALLQRRVALAGLFGTCFGWSFWLYRIIYHALQNAPGELGGASFWLHGLGSLFLTFMWLACRSGVRSPRFVRTVEAVGLVGAAWSYTAMGAAIPAVGRPDYIVLCAMGFSLMARAAYVPSTPRRTAVLTFACAVPAVVMTYAVFSNVDVDKWRVLTATVEGRSAADVGRDITLFNAALWLVAGAMCTLTSRVTYGLRKQVRDARKLGQYTLHNTLGEGGMGMVYRASHAMLRRPTAVKLLSPGTTGETALARFEREVQLTASLSHPNTVTIHDYGRTPDGVFYYAMELLDGATLSEVVELSGPQPVGRVLHTLDHVASALREAHEVGLIHRDIKPSNIMLVRAGGVYDVPKVLDFGLVKEIDQHDPSVSLTHGDRLTGTPQYISPEAIRSPEQVDARSDIYALGAVIYFMLTGEHVFSGRTVVEVCGEHLHATPVPPSSRLGKPVPQALEQLILACLAKQQDDRPATAVEIRARIRALREEYAWSEADAQAWWQRYGAGFAAARDGDSAASEHTIAVDLSMRPS